MDNEMSIDELFAQAKQQEIADREEAARRQRIDHDTDLATKVEGVYKTAQDRQGFLKDSEGVSGENQQRLDQIKTHEDRITALQEDRTIAQAKLDDATVSDDVKELYRKILVKIDSESGEHGSTKLNLQKEVSDSQADLEASAGGLKKRIQKDKETLGFDSDVHNVLAEIENERYAQLHKEDLKSLLDELLKIQLQSNSHGNSTIRPSTDLQRRIEELIRYPLVFEKVYKDLESKRPSVVSASLEIDGRPTYLYWEHNRLIQSPLFKSSMKVDVKTNALIQRAIENPDMTQEEILAEMGSKYEPEVLAAVQDDANKDNERFDINKTLKRESENIEFTIKDLTGRLEYKQGRYDSAVAEQVKYVDRQGMVDAWKAFNYKLDSYGIREFKSQNYKSLSDILKRKKEDLERRGKPALLDFSGKKEYRAKQEELEKMARAIEELKPYQQKIESAADEYGQLYSIEPRSLEEYKHSIVSIQSYRLQQLESELAEAAENLKAHKDELASWEQKKAANEKAIKAAKKE